MSKAFKKDEGDEPLVVARRAPLPEGVPNYVTARGLSALRSEREALLAELARRDAESELAARNALKARLAELEQRIASAVLVDTGQQPLDEVRFGARVELLDSSGSVHGYRIVGVDEADAREGRIAFTAPLARALLGKRLGEAVVVKTPRGEEELEVRTVSYDDA